MPALCPSHVTSSFLSGCITTDLRLQGYMGTPGTGQGLCVMTGSQSGAGACHLRPSQALLSQGCILSWLLDTWTLSSHAALPYLLLLALYFPSDAE